MVDREHILAEIRRCAIANGGRPLGRAAFSRETGIKGAWVDRYWVRWNDAVEAAGFEPNAMTVAHTDDYLLEMLARLTRDLGHYPVRNELRHEALRDSEFPDSKTFSRFGGKSAVLHRLVDFCNGRPDLADVVSIIGAVGRPEDDPQAVATTPMSYVYLAKSGKHYKIGKTNDLVRRTNEIRIQLPERLELIHQIATDDPSGIEDYWHRRFADLRANGEWFALRAAEVGIFKRRRFM